MADFATAFKNVAAVEAGYVFDEKDPGGETYRGISRRSFPMWGGWTTVDLHKQSNEFPKNVEEDATLVRLTESFYEKEFWRACGCHVITDQAVAWIVFDSAVHCGKGTAIRFLQRGLNLMNQAGSLWPDVPADGLYGQQTENAIKSYLAKFGPIYLLKAIVFLRGEYELGLAEKNPNLERFTKGWINRLSMFLKA